jgi:hypothetical protein
MVLIWAVFNKNFLQKCVYTFHSCSVSKANLYLTKSVMWSKKTVCKITHKRAVRFEDLTAVAKKRSAF